MDVNVTWRELSLAIEAEQIEEAEQLAEALSNWLANDGFPPEITGSRKFDRLVARSTCDAVLSWETA